MIRTKVPKAIRSIPSYERFEQCKRSQQCSIQIRRNSAIQSILTSTSSQGKLEEFYAGFHKAGRYHRKATGTHTLAMALTLAEDWYLDCKAAIRINQFKPVNRHLYKDVAKVALDKFQGKVDRGERSATYLTGIKLLMNGDLLPFFGALDVTDIGPSKWSEYEESLRERKTSLTRQTLHQHRNALRLGLHEALRKEWIDRMPQLKIDAVGKREGRPRVWFESDDLEKLLEIAASHINGLTGTRWVDDGHECYDFIIWMVNTGMRVGEAMNVRFCDVEIIKEKAQNEFTEYCCLVKNIKGKRGTGECRSGYAALDAFDRIVARRNIDNSSRSDEKLFLALHRDMFNAILDKASLKITNTDPPRRRDFVSLRHTYIASRLLHGVGVYDLAKNCRTSVTMIENHYARYLSPRLLQNLNRVSQN